MRSQFTRALLLMLAVALLGGCASTRERIKGLADLDLPSFGIPGVYRTNIQQGNVVTQEMVDRLRPGMTRRQVRFVLGEPVLRNTFRVDRWDYVYTVQFGAEERLQQRLTLYFEDGELSRFEGDFLPSAIKDAQERAAEEAEAAAASASAAG